MKTTQQFTINILFALFSIMYWGGCIDILEQDLSKTNIVVLGPKNDFATNSQNITFWWESLEISNVEYELEIVQPSFSSPETLILKEIIDGTTSSQTLNPGLYQWRINAYLNNQSSTSKISSLEITQDSSNDLSSQSINLVRPILDLVTNSTTVEFLWEELIGVDEYYIQLASPDFSNSTFLFVDERTTNDYLNFENLDEGNYRWRVRGENESSITPFSTQEFTVDLTAPNPPELLFPSIQDTISLPSSLTWNSENDVATDSIFVYTDSLGTMPVLLLSTSNEFYTLDAIPTDKIYYWQVKSVDIAGNQSELSSIGRFFVED